jgi:hypothetical protein
MGASTSWLRPSSMLNRLLLAFVAGSPGEVSVNRAYLAAWLAEGRQMRLQASQWAEMPPLPSD